MNEAAVKFETYNSSNPTVNRLQGFKYSKIQRERERNTERESKKRIYQRQNSQPTERERALRSALPAHGPRLSALAEQRRPPGEWVKVRACEDADRVSHRMGHLESIGVSS